MRMSNNPKVKLKYWYGDSYIKQRGKRQGNSTIELVRGDSWVSDKSYNYDVSVLQVYGFIIR